MKDLEHVRHALEGRGAGPRAHSAVLMLLVPDKERTKVLFTLRSPRLTSHPGELSFPGGRIEAQDRDPSRAALRETWEETGIHPSEVELWGHVLDYETFRGTTVALFAGVVQPAAIPNPTPPNAEVDRVVLLPLEELRIAAPEPAAINPHEPPADRAVHHCQVLRHEARRFLLKDADEPRIIHYWELAHGIPLWGITADIVSIVLTRAYGWRIPGPIRDVRTHRDVLPSLPRTGTENTEKTRRP